MSKTREEFVSENMAKFNDDFNKKYPEPTTEQLFQHAGEQFTYRIDLDIIYDCYNFNNKEIN